MLTNPDVTADEQTTKFGKQEKPAKFKSGPGNNQSKK